MHARGRRASWSKTAFRVILILFFLTPCFKLFFPASSDLGVLPLIYLLTKTSNLRCPSVFILKANTAAVGLVLVVSPAMLSCTAGLISAPLSRHLIILLIIKVSFILGTLN